MRTGAAGLDDVEDLIAADGDGLLHSAALAGAQVRSVAEAVREGVLAPLAQLRPRSVVLVYGSAAAARAAGDLVIATMAPRIDVPVVAGPCVPGWIGPLDVVVILGDDAGDMVLADAAARAVRRRADVVAVAPIEGPLRDALAGGGIDLSPRIRVDGRMRMIGFTAALVAVIGALSEVRLSGPVTDLDALADALDAEAAAGHPGQESFHNAAKLLTDRLGAGLPTLTGDGPAASIIAEHASRMLFSVSGTVCTAVELADAARVVADWSARTGASATDSIFYDPEIDGPRPDPAPRVFVITLARREWYTRQRVAGLGDVDILTAESGGIIAEPAMAQGMPGDVPAAEETTELTSLLLVLLRIQMAAVYLRLIRK